MSNSRLRVDGGQTWEPNFIGDLTPTPRQRRRAKNARVDAAQQPARLSTGSWVPGTSQMSAAAPPAETPVPKLDPVERYGGGAEVVGRTRETWRRSTTQGTSGHLEFLALRLYNLKSQQWNLLSAPQQ